MATNNQNNDSTANTNTSDKVAAKLFEGITLQDCDTLVPPPSSNDGGGAGTWNCGDKFNLEKAKEDMKLNTGNYWSTGATKTIAGCKVGIEGRLKNDNYLGKCTPSVAGHITMGGIVWKTTVGWGWGQSKYIGQYGFNKLNVASDTINTRSKIKTWTANNAKVGDVCLQTHGSRAFVDGNAEACGHSCMWDGNYWVSDCVQKNAGALVYGDTTYNLVEIYRFSDCKEVPSQNGGGTPSKNAKIDTSKKALLVTNNQGMNRAYPGGDQASFTKTLVVSFKFKAHKSQTEVVEYTATMNKACKDDFINAMDEIFKTKITVNGVSGYFEIKTFGSYCHRPVKGKPTLSYHSYGVAFDFNAFGAGNPNRRGAQNNTSENSLTKIRNNHPIINICKKYGFGWGGRYGDTMHFSWFNGD